MYYVLIINDDSNQENYTLKVAQQEMDKMLNEMEFHKKDTIYKKEYLYEFMEDCLHKRDRECDFVGAVHGEGKVITKRY